MALWIAPLLLSTWIRLSPPHSRAGQLNPVVESVPTTFCVSPWTPLRLTPFSKPEANSRPAPLGAAVVELEVVVEGVVRVTVGVPVAVGVGPAELAAVGAGSGPVVVPGSPVALEE